jgi:hypothetical protein
MRVFGNKAGGDTTRGEGALTQSGRLHVHPETVNETLMKQFPNATKPFWRFRANVLKRFIGTGFPNDAPRTARQDFKTGATNV